MHIKLEKQEDGRNFILLDGVPTVLAFSDEIIVDLHRHHHSLNVKEEFIDICESAMKESGDPRLTDEVIAAIIDLVGTTIDMLTKGDRCQ